MRITIAGWRLAGVMMAAFGVALGAVVTAFSVATS